MRVWTPKPYEDAVQRHMTRSNFSNTSATHSTSSAKRPSTAGSVKLSMSASLPKLPPAVSAPQALSPIGRHPAGHPPGRTPYDEPAIILRRRNRELEQALKRMSEKLHYDNKTMNDLEQSHKDLELALRAEYERRLLLAEQERGKALQEAKVREQYELDKLRSELTGVLTGAAAEEAAAREAKYKEERIELLRRQVARRMLNQGLAYGFSAWLEMWQSKRYAIARLQQVAGRLRSPELSMAFGFWSTDYQEDKQARLADAAQAAASGLSAQAFQNQQLQQQLRERSAELERTKSERNGLEARVAFLEDDGAARLKSEHAERIELLRRQVTRRMLNQGITNGFSAWLEMWQAKRYAIARLREVAVRLCAPELSDAFGFWFTNMAEEKRAAADAASAEQSQTLRKVRSSLEFQIDEQRRDYDRRLAELQEEMRVALERQHVELVGSAEQQAASREAKQKKERIELLRRQVARRMLNQGLANGFTAWLEMWTAKTHAIQRLRAVANRLRTPELSIAFGSWASEMIGARAAAQSSEFMLRQVALEAERDELLVEVRRARAEAREKVAELSTDRIALMKKVALLTNGAAEKDALNEAREAANKEERLEVMRVKFTRRMLNQDLANGFSAWLEMWQAKRYAISQLQQAAIRLRTPELSSAFGHWISDMEMERQKQAHEKLSAQRDTQFHEETERLRHEADELRAQYEAATEAHRADVERAKLELDRQRVELIGSAEEKAAQRAEQEREERVELLKRQSLRRLLMQDLAFGFDAWSAQWHAMRRLRQIAGHLRAPALSQSFESWSTDCRNTKQQARVAMLETECKDRDGAVRRAEYEASRLKMLNTALEDENAYLKEKLTKVADLSSQQAAELSTARPQLASQAFQIEQLTATLKEQQELTAATEQKRTEIEAEAAKQLHLAQETLERLLAEQRETFENDLAGLRQRIAGVDQEREAIEKQLTDAKAQIEKLQEQITQINNKTKAAKEQADKKRSQSVGGRPFEYDPEKPISMQLAAALRSNGARVIDLFRQWDTDGDGEVSKAEFMAAMPKLGFDVPKEGIAQLFDEWDTDGGGALSLGELKKILSQRPAGAAAPAAAPPRRPTLAGAGKVAKLAAAASKAK